MKFNSEHTLMASLINKFKCLVDIPFEPASQQQNKINIVISLINMGMIITLVYILPTIALRGWLSNQVIFTFVLLGILLLARMGINKGFVNQVSLLLMISVWVLVIFLFLFLENGLRAPIYTVMIAFLITYAGLLHGRFGATLITTFTLIISASVVLGESQGYYLTTPRVSNVYWTLFGQMIFFTAITFLVNRTVSNLQQSIIFIQTEKDNLQKAQMEVKNLHEQLQAAYDTTLQGWSQALELRDKETLGHSRRVTEMTIELSRAMGISDEKELQQIRYGALLHDIGKMGIPDYILLKPGPLNTEEWKIMKQHPVLAHQMLSNISYLAHALDIPYSHHERWDGTGYPQGLKGNEIPLRARIFAIVDVWDALSTDRPYRSAWPAEKVHAYILEKSGSQFDPLVEKTFLAYLDAHTQ